MASGVRTLPLRTARRSWAVQAHIAPRSWPQTKIPSVVATRLLRLGPSVRAGALGTAAETGAQGIASGLGPVAGGSGGATAGLFLGIVELLGAGVGFLGLYGYAELILLLISIEENTRKL